MSGILFRFNKYPSSLSLFLFNKKAIKEVDIFTCLIHLILICTCIVLSYKKYIIYLLVLLLPSTTLTTLSQKLHWEIHNTCVLLRTFWPVEGSNLVLSSGRLLRMTRTSILLPGSEPEHSSFGDAA